MSYESEMLSKNKMPARNEVEKALLLTLFNHNGTIKEFGAGEKIVDEIANIFDLKEKQRNLYLETIYRKENRLKKSNLWHRLLFRAADNLAKQKLISRPSQTALLTDRKEWMLTERGYDEALKLSNIPSYKKDYFSIKSYEVEKLVKKIKERKKPDNYNPINYSRTNKKKKTTTKIRGRSFRQAIIETYDYKCAVCGLKIYSPKTFQWEVEAAHIVPYKFKGKDDIWNGLSLCRFHHWAFDVGWYGVDNDFKIITSRNLSDLPSDMGKTWNFELMKILLSNSIILNLPQNKGYGQI